MLLLQGTSKQTCCSDAPEADLKRAAKHDVYLRICNCCWLLSSCSFLPFLLQGSLGCTIQREEVHLLRFLQAVIKL